MGLRDGDAKDVEPYCEYPIEDAVVGAGEAGYDAAAYGREEETDMVE